MIKKVVSGAQTGADRAALDVAMEMGFTYGGWVPRGRLAEDGTIPQHYEHLKETPEEETGLRTEWNIRDSDATLIISHGPLDGGSLYTRVQAEAMGRPWLHLDLDETGEEGAVRKASEWLASVRPHTLNVAGPRASRDPYIYEKTRRILGKLLRITRPL
ncbi:MAG: putative molybdenum carrier protein [Balneolales bacterium]